VLPALTMPRSVASPTNVTAPLTPNVLDNPIAPATTTEAG
jgi:hypothetical protein